MADISKKFQEIHDEILGKEYDLSWAFISPAKIKKLNLIYRNINKPTDILSFPISKTEGEIYICKSEARKECKKFDRTYENFLLFIFIHGCVHLKGYDHGSTMERIEAKFRKQFGI
jgi:probable rRNA maturation factor